MEEKIIRHETVVDENGEIKRDSKTYKVQVEPPYVKLYFEHLLTLKSVSKSLSPILYALVMRMTYAGSGDNGGQVIVVNKFIKEAIAAEVECSISRIDQALRELVKGGVLRKLGRGTYQVNAKYFGKGDWKDIRLLRAEFDYNELEVEANVVFNESS